MQMIAELIGCLSGTVTGGSKNPIFICERPPFPHVRLKPTVSPFLLARLRSVIGLDRKVEAAHMLLAALETRKADKLSEEGGTVARAEDDDHYLCWSVQLLGHVLIGDIH